MENQQERQTKLGLLQVPEMDNYFVDTIELLHQYILEGNYYLQK